MKIFLTFIIGLVIGQISYKMAHHCESEVTQEIALLKKQVEDRDSLLYRWFNDYAFHMRLVSGLEKDSTVIKYQTWNHDCIGWKKRKIKASFQ